MKNIFAALVFAFIFSANAMAEANPREVNGIWRGRLTSTLTDECGLGDDTRYRFRHRITPSSMARNPTLIALRDLDNSNVRGVSLLNQHGQTRTGSYFTVVLGPYRDNGTNVFLMYQYRNVRNNRADVQFGFRIVNRRTGQQCVTAYGGTARR